MIRNEYYCQKCDESITKKQFGKTYFNPDIYSALCPDCEQNPNVSKGTDKQRKLAGKLREIGIDAIVEYKVPYKTGDSYRDKHIDIVDRDARLNIEVDDPGHIEGEQARNDLWRTYYALKEGWLTLRIPNVLTEDMRLEETAKAIVAIHDLVFDQLEAEEPISHS